MLKSRDLIKKKIERAKAYVHYDYKKLWLCQKSFTIGDATFLIVNVST